MARADGRTDEWQYSGAPENGASNPAVFAAGLPVGEGMIPLVPVLVFAVVALAFMRRRGKGYYWSSARKGGRFSPEEPLLFADPEPWQIGRTLFCPICTDEYLAEAERCDDCGVQLVEEEDLAERGEARIEEGIVRALRITSGGQVHVIRSLLSANRIPCSFLRCTPCDVFGTDVFVFESDALRAKRLVRQFISDPDLVQFN